MQGIGDDHPCTYPNHACHVNFHLYIAVDFLKVCVHYRQQNFLYIYWQPMKLCIPVTPLVYR